MNTYDEMTHNATLMKRCRRIYNTVSIIYAGICIPYALSQLFMLILSVSCDQLYLLFDGVIFKSALLFFGYMGCYTKKTKYALFAVGVITFNILINAAVNMASYFDYLVGAFLDVNSLIFAAVIALAFITALTNRKYHYLEEQFGFPYFNERIEENNLDRIQNSIKSEYQQKYEYLTRKNPHDMQDVSSAVRSADIEASTTHTNTKKDRI